MQLKRLRSRLGRINTSTLETGQIKLILTELIKWLEQEIENGSEPGS